MRVWRLNPGRENSNLLSDHNPDGRFRIPAIGTASRIECPIHRSGLADKPVADYLGYESCRKCHQLQVEKLMTTAHFKSYETVHRSEASKTICRQLGIRSIKRDERCVRCHYTPEIGSRGVRAQSGISCESCHGPSKNWVQGHNDYGGLQITREQETRQHRAFRIESSITKGMRHPSNLYLLAKSCYECHLVDDAEIVNVTDHPPISNEFNMVSWSQGTMRHNFLRTDNRFNAESTDERKRVMFVVDLLARLEATLIALSSSPEGTKHHDFMKREYFLTAKQLLKVAELARNSEIDEVIEVLKSTPPDASSELRLSAAAEISRLAFEFGKRESDHDLQAIQDLLPPKNEYK